MLLSLAQDLTLLGLSAGIALMWVGLAMAAALGMGLAAAMTSTRSSPSAPPPPDPQGCISTLAGDIERIRAGLPAGNYRSWSEHGPPLVDR